MYSNNPYAMNTMNPGQLAIMQQLMGKGGLQGQQMGNGTMSQPGNSMSQPQMAGSVAAPQAAQQGPGQALPGALSQAASQLGGAYLAGKGNNLMKQANSAGSAVAGPGQSGATLDDELRNKALLQQRFGMGMMR